MDDTNLTPDEQRLLKIVNLGITQVVVPVLDSLEEEMNNRFDKIDARFEKVDARFDRLDNKLDRVADQVVEHDQKIKNLETPKTIVAHTIKR